MLQTIPDPFDSYGPERPEDQIFSILPPLSILATPSGPASASAGSPSASPTPAFYPTSDDEEYGSSVAASSSPPGIGGVGKLYPYPGGGPTVMTPSSDSTARQSWITPATMTPSFTGGGAAAFFDGANAEWATAPSSLASTSSSLGAMSPPPSSRGMSTSSFAGNHNNGVKKTSGSNAAAAAAAPGGLPRRSSVGAESKLRSVLTVDEDKSNGSVNGNNESDSSSGEVSTIRANGDSSNYDDGDDDRTIDTPSATVADAATFANGGAASTWANLTYGESPYSGLSFLSSASNNAEGRGVQVELEDDDNTPRTSRHFSDDMTINGNAGHLRSGSGSSSSSRRQRRSGSTHSDDTAQVPLGVS
jgi:hypothetical protein